MYGERMINDFQAAFDENLEWNSSNEILVLAKNICTQEIKPEIYMSCGIEDYFRDDNNLYWTRRGGFLYIIIGILNHESIKIMWNNY